MSSTNEDQWHAQYVLDFHRLVRKVWGGRWWIVASSVLVGAVALLIGYSTTPVFRASTVLISASREQATMGNALGSLGGLAALAGVNLAGPDTATREALGLLRSRQFALDFIKDFDLKPLFFEDKWDAAAGKWKVPPEDEPTDAEAVRFFDENVRNVRDDSRNGLIILEVDWRDREAAATWANEMVERLNAQMRRRAIDRADASLKYLEKEFESTSVLEARTTINRLMEAQINQRMLANVTTDFAFRVVDRAQVPDLGDKVRPRKLLMLLAGGFLGFLAGIVGVLIFRRTDK
jgi:uncharacterized protein involved in exopolysaccharide biosynthesis